MRTCYVSAPAQSSRKGLEAAIRDAGYAPVDVTDFTASAASASDALLRTLKEVNAVVGVVNEAAPDNANVLVELGMAVALGKRVVVFGELKRQPPQLADAVWLRAEPGDYEPVRFALSHLERLPEKPRRRRRRAEAQGAPPPPAPVPPDVFESERALIDFLAETFERAGGIAIGRETASDRFDLGLWSNDSKWVVGNPIMVEVKTNITSPRLLREVAHETSGRIAGSNVEWALLIYATGIDSEAAEEAARGSRVLPFRLDSLLEQLEHEPLAEVLRRARNVRVHG
jgi:hypothetical protein